MEFFDSVQLLAISRQRRGLFDKKADNENMLIAESRLLTAAKAHYYHAVGLTERDDIVGACEHYLTALEIMEPLVETSPLWRLWAFYLDSYLGLAKRENTLQSGSFISAIVEAKIEENRELQGERIFHQLIATYGVPVINDDNNNPSN